MSPPGKVAMVSSSVKTSAIKKASTKDKNSGIKKTSTKEKTSPLIKIAKNEICARQRVSWSERMELMKGHATTKCKGSKEVISQDEFMNIILKDGAGSLELSELFTFHRPIRKAKTKSAVLALTDQQHDAMYALSGCHDVTYLLGQVRKEVRSALLTVYNISPDQIFFWFKNRRAIPKPLLKLELQPSLPISGSRPADKSENNLLPLSGSLIPSALAREDLDLKPQVSLRPHERSLNRPDYGSGALNIRKRSNSFPSDIVTKPQTGYDIDQTFERAKRPTGEIEDQFTGPEICQTILSESDRLWGHSAYFSLSATMESIFPKIPYISPHLFLNHEGSFTESEIDLIIAQASREVKAEKEKLRASASLPLTSVLDQLAVQKSKKQELRLFSEDRTMQVGFPLSLEGIEGIESPSCSMAFKKLSEEYLSDTASYDVLLDQRMMQCDMQISTQDQPESCLVPEMSALADLSTTGEALEHQLDSWLPPSERQPLDPFHGKLLTELMYDILHT